ncbi:Nephrocystin-3, partial [Paramuricea clavata]
IQGLPCGMFAGQQKFHRMAMQLQGRRLSKLRTVHLLQIIAKLSVLSKLCAIKLLAIVRAKDVLNMMHNILGDLQKIFRGIQMHYMIHLPKQTLHLGPLIRHSSMKIRVVAGCSYSMPIWKYASLVNIDMNDTISIKVTAPFSHRCIKLRMFSVCQRICVTTINPYKDFSRHALGLSLAAVSSLTHKHNGPNPFHVKKICQMPRLEHGMTPILKPTHQVVYRSTATGRGLVQRFKMFCFLQGWATNDETDPNDPLLDEVAEKLDHQPLAMAAAALQFSPNSGYHIVYHHMGELEQAKNYHQRAMEIREKKLGSNHVDVANSYNNLGTMYLDMGELEQAKNYHLRAIEIQEKKLGSNHVDVATSYNSLGTVYRHMGELEQAKNYHQRAVEIQEKKLGSNHVDVANSYNNLGTVYRHMGELEQAKDYHLRAIEIQEKKLGSNHVDAASSYNNLGTIYHDIGELEQAKDYHLRAIEIREKKLGSNHVDVATSYNNLGAVYRQMGELEQAKDYHLRAIEIREKKLGSNHVDVATSYNNLGAVYRQMGELEQAKDYHLRAIEIREKKLGSNHVDVATSYNNLAMEIREKKLGSNHVDVANSYNNLGLNHVDVATSYNNIGAVYHRMGELEKAKNYYIRAMKIRKKQLGSNHVNVATSYNNIGVVYGDMGELEKARNYHLRAMEIREKLKLNTLSHVGLSAAYILRNYTVRCLLLEEQSISADFSSQTIKKIKFKTRVRLQLKKAGCDDIEYIRAGRILAGSGGELRANLVPRAFARFRGSACISPTSDNFTCQGIRSKRWLQNAKLLDRAHYEFDPRSLIRKFYLSASEPRKGPGLYVRNMSRTESKSARKKSERRVVMKGPRKCDFLRCKQYK